MMQNLPFYFIKKRFIAFCLLSLSLCYNGVAQKQIGCFSVEQLEEIYSSNSLDVNLLLAKERWNLTNSQENAVFEKDGESMEYGVITWKNPLSFDTAVIFHFYYKPDYPNIIEMNVSENCYVSLQAAMGKKYKHAPVSLTEGQYKQTIYGKQEQTEYLVVFSEALDRSAYWVLYCPTKIDKIFSERKAERQRLKAEQEAKRRRIEDALFSADSLRGLGKPEQALVFVERLPKDFEEYNEVITFKIEIIKKEIKTKKIKQSTEEGELLYEQQKWEQAEKKFNEVLELDKDNQAATHYLELIEKKYDVIDSVKKGVVYDYQKFNPNAYASVLTRLEKGFNDISSAHSKGKYSLWLDIHFDVLGENHSSYVLKNKAPQKEVAGNVDTAFSQWLDEVVVANFLKPAYVEGILVNASKESNFSLEWGTQHVRLIRKSASFKTKPQSGFAQKDTLVKRYIKNNYPNCVGVYGFSVKTKSLNRNLSADIKLDKFRTVGPEAMVYSMLYPGAGTLAATRGEKGGKMLASFTVFGAATLACLYLHTHNVIKTDIPYAKYAFFGCGAISGALYVSEMFIALSHGCKNRKKSKEIRAALEKGSIDIVQETIVIPQN